MASDILEQLADAEVPPAPVDALKQGFNERLNSRLVVQQVLDFALHGIPYTALHMLRGVFAVFYFTIAGKFVERKEDAGEDED